MNDNVATDSEDDFIRNLGDRIASLTLQEAAWLLRYLASKGLNFYITKASP